MLPLGTKAPPFTLLDTISGNQVSLQQLVQPGSKGTVIMFICNHCPYVIHLREALVKFARREQEKGVNFIAISSNDVVNYPDDSPAKMKEMAETFHFSFPYLYDETQEVAKAYQAACTPDFYLFDQSLKLVYRGQFDDSRPGSDTPVTGQDLKRAIDALLSGGPLPKDEEQKPSMGCNIKWIKQA